MKWVNIWHYKLFLIAFIFSIFFKFLLVEENFKIEVCDKGEKESKKLPIFSFPKGKQMRDENELECASREVIEETAYDKCVSNDPSKGRLNSTLFFEEEVFPISCAVMFT